MRRIVALFKRIFCRSKPVIEPRPPVFHIDQRDLTILREIHLAFARGCDEYLISRTPSPEQDYTEAEILVKNYGLRREEVLERTGFYVE